MDRQSLTSYFNELMDTHYDDLLSYLAHRCGRLTLAKDLTQEVFLKVWMDLCNNKEKPDSWRAWLRCLGSNKLNDFLRQPWQRKRRPLNEDGSDPPDNKAADVPHQIIASETTHAVREGVASLQGLLRQVAEWRQQGHSNVDIEGKLRQLGLPASKATVERLWRKARLHLQEVLASSRDNYPLRQTQG